MSDASRADRDCWIGFDLGGTKMMAAVLDGDMKPLGKERKKTKGHEGVEIVLERIIKTIRDALADAEAAPSRLAGIGVGCPGPLDLERGVVIDAPNLGWKNVPLKEVLEKAFDCPAVIANDVDAGVFGEYHFGAGKNARCVIGVFPGTGIGGGCVYEGKILRGRNRTCMEIGHVQVVPYGPLCACGQRGCLETVAGRMAIAAESAKAAFRGDAPHLMETAGADLANIRSGALASSIKAGDKVIERIVREAAGRIGVAVASVIHLLAPDVVVLGGGLVEAMPDLFVGSVAKSANKHVMASYVDSFRVVPCALGDDSTMLGAAAWARDVVSAAPRK
ncbi:MAG: ROK family protein [Planctomycetes bacterium]|nr:ROK family protein [Planctomycetota bacterium]